MSDAKKRTLVPFRRYLVGFTAIILFVAPFSCSVEKNTSLSRNYHNLTSHYNIYFNGKEAFLKGMEKAESTVMYDFTSILPVFLYEDESLHGPVSPSMKTAIDKATKVITFHSIKAKPKVKEGDQSAKDKAFHDRNEYNKWVDDCYMLMGRSYMYQGEFFLAAETFKHVLVTFPADEIRFQAMTWLARAYIMIDESREADRLLVALADENNFPEEYMGELLTTRAQFEMYNDSYASAAEYLENALLQKGLTKDEKIRFTFILAQLYEEVGEKSLSQEKYRRVNRYNPPYEIAFNARVSMAEVFESGSENSNELKKLLNKMLRDSKNTEYKDQIYYALGNIAFEEDKREQAIEYYQLSVSTSVQNLYQKGFSSLTLADIYYEEPDYILSAAYYDSAVSFLNKDYPGYKGLVTLSASLSGLVYNIHSYSLEDSVQMLAGLPENDRLAIIDEIIEEVRKAEEEAKLAEQQAMQDMAFNQSMMYDNQTSGTTGQQAGQWYFYNLSAKSFGQPEFKMKWGERKLEDNWRRKNRQTLSSMQPGGADEGDSIEGGKASPMFDNKSREFYLANIPLDDSSMTVSNLRLEDALFNMGVIYKENLLDYQEAIDAFEEILDRFPFPEGRYNDRALYYLYELYNNTQRESLAQKQRAQLMAEYPESHYTMLLTNPNYLKELEEEEMKVVRLYEGIFSKYQLGDYQGVIQDADSAVAQYPGDPLVSKFMYIKALSLGGLVGKEEMKTEFDSLISQHPGTEESLQAQEIIDYMYVAFPVIKEADEAKEAEEIYSGYDPGQEHYFLIALQSGENINQVSFDLLNYNLDNFNEYNLEIERLDLTDEYNMLVVQLFTNADGASRYMEVIQNNSKLILSGVAPSNFRMMIISRDNYVTLSEEKVHNPYYLFYLKHYLIPE